MGKCSVKRHMIQAGYMRAPNSLEQALICYDFNSSPYTYLLGLNYICP